ncbi:caspase family protein [Calothrix sp. FACHB-156]|nr:caspase family protein [Calothrix sp. FACHB-156]
MSSQLNVIPNFYALLIGIDRYLPNQLPDGSSYKSLHGCVRDIDHVEALLKNMLKVPKAQIFKLVASHANGCSQSSEQLPTYENMVTKFKELTAIAQPGDQVYIHYSGHGGRPVTAYPEIKGKYAIDESLVPMDIGNSQARYLRDMELAKLLQSMVNKGLVVTLVLDSCHSGGATRGGIENTGVRGLSKNIVDTTPRPTESLVASTEELIQNWQSLTKREERTRSLTATSGWLPEPKGYVLLAACRDHELAHERPFNSKENNGVLTYWLLDSLKTLGTEITYKTLHDRILAKIYGESKQQTPMLQGEGDRLVFKGQSMSFQYAVTVLKVDLLKNRVLLQAGAAQAIAKGAELAIYKLGTTDFSQTDKRVALARIIEVDAEASWAEITKIMPPEEPTRTLRLYPTPAAIAPTQASIQDGAPALLLSPGVKLIRKVRLLPPQANWLPKGIDSKKALAAVRTTKAMVEGNRRLEFLSEDEISNEVVAYYVSINEKGEYEILDADGKIINLRPSLKVEEPNAASSVVRRLVHLSQYDAILQLDNNSPISNLKGKLKVELCSDAKNWAELKPFNAPGNVPTMQVGECGYLRIRNESNQDLNITVLLLQPDWSIGQLHPEAPSAFELLEHGKEKLIRLCASLPKDYTQGADIIKVFATVGATNFSWLKLPPLDQPPTRMQTTRASNPLEELLASVKSDNPTRNLTAVTLSNDNWTTAEIKIFVNEI